LPKKQNYCAVDIIELQFKTAQKSVANDYLRTLRFHVRR